MQLFKKIWRKVLLWRHSLRTIMEPSLSYVSALSSSVSPWHGMCCGISRKESQTVVRYRLCRSGSYFYYTFSDSNQCQRKRGPKTTVDETADKPRLLTSPIYPASHSCQSIWTFAVIGLLLCRSYGHDCLNKLCVQWILGCIGKVMLNKNLIMAEGSVFHFPGYFTSMKIPCKNT